MNYDLASDISLLVLDALTQAGLSPDGAASWAAWMVYELATPSTWGQA